MARTTSCSRGLKVRSARRARILGRHVGWVSAVLLWLAGAYVVYYWLTAIRLL